MKSHYKVPFFQSYITYYLFNPPCVMEATVMYKQILRYLGIFAFVVGIAEVLHVFQPFVRYFNGYTFEISFVLKGLLSVLMGLLLMYTGFVLLKNIPEKMFRSGMAMGAYIVVAIAYIAQEFFRPPHIDMVLSFNLITMFPVWLMFISFYEYHSSVNQQGEMEIGKYRFIGLFFVLLILAMGALLAGDLLHFIDPASLFLMLMPLPILLVLSGLRIPLLFEFFAGIFSLSYVQQKHISTFKHFARKAGSFSVYLGLIVTLVGTIMTLENFNSSNELATSMAVALISLLYGLILKLCVFDPYAYILEGVE
ncbi:MAG: MotA/TolQ/ExbB proton channel family protein [bacterium]